MDLVVIVGGSISNSYGTLAEANTYFEGRFVSGEDWSGLTNSQKEVRLVQAARFLDRLLYQGMKSGSETTTDDDYQKMQWPRRKKPLANINDNGLYLTRQLIILGNKIPTDAIPDDIKYAQFELARVIWDSSGNTLTKENRLEGGAVVLAETLKSYSIRYAPDSMSTKDIEGIPGEALQFITPYLSEDIDLLRQ